MKNLQSRIEQAFNLVKSRFPFKGYMDHALPACITICEAIMRLVPPESGVNVLDFACGPCDKTAVLASLGYHCSGYDDLEDDWHKIPGKRLQIDKFIIEMGIDFKSKAEGPFSWLPGSFDVVMMNDILEHLHDSPRQLLNGLLPLLKDDGLLLITVPSAVNIRKRLDVICGHTNLARFESYFWYPGSWRGHIREYTKWDLIQLAKFMDLEIVELRSCDHMLQIVPPMFRLPYRIVTGVFTGWKDSWLLVARRNKNWQPKELRRSEIDEILKRFGGSY